MTQSLTVIKASKLIDVERVKDKFGDWTQNTEHRKMNFAAVSTDSTEDSQR